MYVCTDSCEWQNPRLEISRSSQKSAPGGSTIGFGRSKSISEHLGGSQSFQDESKSAPRAPQQATGHIFSTPRTLRDRKISPRGAKTPPNHCLEVKNGSPGSLKSVPKVSKWLKLFPSPDMHNCNTKTNVLDVYIDF